MIKHAETSAIIIDDILKQNQGLVNNEERKLIVYAIAAHTNYFKPQEILLSSQKIIREPYLDISDNKEPIWFVWVTRWIDRLDLASSAGFAREYLVAYSKLSEKDSNANKLSDIMALEPDAPGGLLKNCEVFVSTQSNDSVYGQHDFGLMVELRDTAKDEMRAALEAAKNPKLLSEDKQEDMLSKWTEFVAEVIEPAPLGRVAANDLQEKFAGLQKEDKNAWCNGFQVAIEGYKKWEKRMMSFLRDFDDDVFCLPGITKDVRKRIKSK